ncbi:MAG: GNAT family N-acetyltransferase [Clostridia bacterium]|nr:GNAT family N-acetyltransferase [Clostridia bacterium]
MSSVELRKISEKDREIFFEMSRDFYSCGAAHAPISEENRINFWKEVLSGEFINGYIINFGGEIAGYALVAYYASQEYGGKIALFDELYIKPALRGHGIGKKVFEFVEASGAVACRLEVEKSNERAMKLYSSLGYEEFDYIQMSKKIRKNRG